MIYLFDDCELDVGRVLLRRDGQVVPVEPQVFEVLRLLIERRGQLVTKEELLDTVWGSRFVGESALTSRVKSARRAVGDNGVRQQVIRTAHGKGYEFVATVRTIRRPRSDEMLPLPEPIEAGNSLAHLTASATLPLAVNALIGRDELLEQLEADLEATRLLTIVGSAGVGKTSVGLELARRVVGRLRDGVVLVELVAVGGGGEALAAIATALDLNLRRHSSTDAAIVEMLRPRNLLLLLDNCEHLVEPLAGLAEQILRAAPGVTMVVTSREPLATAGERVHLVEPLEVSRLDPAQLDSLSLEDLAGLPAVALFVERACAADARFELTTSTAPAVAEICRRLDGVPLALELAASRTHAIDVAELARRLDERLRLLRAVRRGADPRHGTLVDAISWSYDLLDADEKRLFTKLAVFAGAFDLEAAESICGDEDVIELLTRLSQRSMIAVRRPASGGTRYEMLETLREFGLTRLDGLANVELFQSHSRHFARVAASVESDLQTPDEPAAMRRGDRSFADLRAAVRFAVQAGDADTAIELVTSIREYGMRSLRYEVFGWAEAVAPLVDEEAHPLRPTLTALRAYGAFVRGEFDVSLRLAEAAVADQSVQGTPSVGLVERVQANVLYLMGDQAGAEDACVRLIAAGDESGNASHIAHANYMSSVGASSADEMELARARYEAVFQAARRSGSPTDLASAWTAKGFALRDQAASLEAFAAADRLARAAGNRWMSAFACTEASSLRVNQGDAERGCAGLAETVDIWFRAGEWAQQWLTLSRCVIALARIGKTELAAEVLGAIESHTTVEATPVSPSVRDLAIETRQALVVGLGSDRAGELRAAGANLPVTTLVHRARSALLGLPDDG